MSGRPDVAQEARDAFYWQNGPCCAGCDWWDAANSSVGDCTRSAPMPGADRMAMIGISSCSAPLGAGHAITARSHRCGEFKDEFDWSSLPLAYLKRVGAPLSPLPQRKG